MNRPTILIVDDEAEILKSLASILEDEFNILAASNGRNVLPIISSNSVSLLILDLRMPEVSGLKLIESIRSRDNTTPIFVMTGDSIDEKDKRLAALNVQEFIRKPVDIEILRDKIRIALKK